MPVRPSSPAHVRAVKKYNKENARTYSLTLFMHSEADIIERLEKEPSKRAYLIGLIRDDIEREKRMAFNQEEK